MSVPVTEKKSPPDWELIEADYRAGTKSVLQIATEHGISHTAINKRFKKLGITRDLSAKIKAKADALVSMAEVSTKVSTETTLRDADIINANAEVRASILIAHRKDIARSRRLTMTLLEELEGMTDCRDLLADLGEMLREPDEHGNDKRNDLYNKIISGASRIDGMKKLSETLKNLIALEREVYSLGSVENPTGQTTVVVQQNNNMTVHNEVRQIVRDLESEF